MDAAARGAKVPVLLHEVDESDDGLGLEVNVPVQGQQVGVLRDDLLALVRDGQLHQLEAQQVVHVHALRPALLVTDLGLVLEVADDLGLPRQGPHQAAAIGGWVSLGSFNLREN